MTQGVLLAKALDACENLGLPVVLDEKKQRAAARTVRMRINKTSGEDEDTYATAAHAPIDVLVSMLTGMYDDLHWD
jgi:hypothetical protein